MKLHRPTPTETAEFKIPDWASKGLAEATRISDVLMAERANGHRRWTEGTQLWEVRVAAEYVDVSTDAGFGLVEGLTGASASVERFGQKWEFVRDGKKLEWLLWSWSEPR